MTARRRRGAPMLCPTSVLARILCMHRDGMNCPAIARVLNEDGIRKPAGGHGWERFHVRRLLGTADAKTMAAELFGEG
ncbi:hypothetical protein [Nocardia niwae]|uniref:hypothetical protein n=1 Tax=Nocardia niwae TaxID=626084 RepID=UPI0033EE5A4F